MIHRQDRQTNFLRFFGNTDLRSYATFSFRNEGKSCKINIFLIAFQLSFLFNYYFFFFDFPYVLSGLMHVTAADDAPTVPFDPVSHSTLFCLRVLTRTRNIRPTAGEAFFWLTFFSSSFSSTFFFFFSVVCGSVYTRWRSPPSIEKNAGDDHFPTLCVCAYVRHQPSPLPYTHRHTCVRARTSPHALTLLILNSVQGEMQGG